MPAQHGACFAGPTQALLWNPVSGGLEHLAQLGMLARPKKELVIVSPQDVAVLPVTSFAPQHQPQMGVFDGRVN